jgi:hypothetical protein
MKPTSGFVTINCDDTRRQKVDRVDEQDLREDKIGCVGLGAQRGPKRFCGEICGLDSLNRADCQKQKKSPKTDRPEMVPAHVSFETSEDLSRTYGDQLDRIRPLSDH